MDDIKSIAVPITRRRTPAGKSITPKLAGTPMPPADGRVGGSVGAGRRVAGAVAPSPKHRFRVGERLQMNAGGRTLSRMQAICKVMALLPHDAGPLLYRVRSEVESYERVVAEADLSPLG